MRLNINTTGHQIDAEEIVVPSSSPYVVRLKHHWVKEETPSGVEVWTDSGKLESQLTEEAYDGNPSSGDKFQVDYKGEQDTEPVYKNAILFHSFQAGKTFYVWYKSQGDVYCAEDINAKADKDSDAVAGNLAEFDANGNPVDSGKKVTDFVQNKNATGTIYLKTVNNTLRYSTDDTNYIIVNTLTDTYGLEWNKTTDSYTRLNDAEGKARSYSTHCNRVGCCEMPWQRIG
mgnify:CR=1 FL=1